MRAIVKRTIYLATTAFLTISCACSENSKEDDSKQEYKPQQNIVEVLELKRGIFHHQLLSNGVLAATSRSSLSFRTDGVVAKVNFDNGQTVHKGDTIATLFSDTQRNAYESSLLALKKAELEFYDVLAGQGYLAKDTVPEEIVSMAKMRSGYDAALNNLQRASFDLSSCALVAPFTGKLANLNITPYSKSKSEEVCTLIDDSRMYVEFSVLESEYRNLSKGLKISIIPYAQKECSYTGVVESINPIVDKNGQIKVKAALRNDGSLIEGMNVKVCVERNMPGYFVVPKSAVVIRDNEEVIFRYSDGKSLWTYVNVLMANSESYAIIANEDRGAEFSEGDMVIISGNLNIADGSSVTLKE